MKELYDKFLECTSVETDTRVEVTGSMFFALKGENFDANTFAAEAVKKNARYVVIDDPKYMRDDPAYILVEDSLRTLQELAHYHRDQLGLPIIALTGSNGKTTTKELIYAVLSKHYKVYATRGNYNNHIGVPLTLLAMDCETEFGIVEMGANHFGEIARLCEIAEPDFGYITNFGKAHLEGFGSPEGVIKAKTELYEYLKQHREKVFVNEADEVQLKLTDGMQVISVWPLEKDTKTQPMLRCKIGDHWITTHLVGDYNLANVSVAVAIGQYFEVPVDCIIEAIAGYLPDNKRSQFIEKENIRIILDAYNANPTSMMAALENFSKGDTKHKIPILGDMFELGAHSLEEHQKIADYTAHQGFAQVILIGKAFAQTQSPGAIHYEDYNAFAEAFNADIFKGSEVLIKASRGMALERIVSLFD